jgi:hypothetical protein
MDQLPNTSVCGIFTSRRNCTGLAGTPMQHIFCTQRPKDAPIASNAVLTFVQDFIDLVRGATLQIECCTKEVSHPSLHNSSLFGLKTELTKLHPPQSIFLFERPHTPSRPMMIVHAPNAGNSNFLGLSSNHNTTTININVVDPKNAATASIALLSSKFRLVVPTAIRDMTTLKAAREIGSDYEPSDVDIFCGRGKGFYNRPGNKSFRTLVGSYIPAYLAAKTKVDKSAVLNTIVDKVRNLHDPTTGRPAQFIKFSKKTGWVEIGDEQAREKVGHAMREAISTVEEGGSSSVDKSVVPPSNSKPVHKAKAAASRKAPSQKAATTSKNKQPLTAAAAPPKNGNFLPMESINVAVSSSCRQQEGMLSMMNVDEDLEDEPYLNEFARQLPIMPSTTMTDSATTTGNNNSSTTTNSFLWGGSRRRTSGRSSFLSTTRDSMSSDMMRAAIESFIGI